MVEQLYEHFLLFQHRKIDYCSSMIIFFGKSIIYFLLDAVLQMLILLMLLEILLG